MENYCISKTIDSQIGVREVGANNGYRVNLYQKSTGNKAGDSWCASFVKWCLLQCGILTPITGWSPSAHNPKNVIYSNRRFEQEPKNGDVFTIYSISQKRINHTGFYRNYYNDRIYETVEGNTNIDGSNNGIGVFKRKRSYNATHSITRWE